MNNKFTPNFFTNELFSDLITDKELLEKISNRANEIFKQNTSIWYLNPKMPEQASQEQRWTDTHFMITTDPVSIQDHLERENLKKILNNVMDSVNLKKLN